MKVQEEKEREENLKNPKPYNGVWPYKFPGEENQPAGQGTNPGNPGGGPVTGTGTGAGAGAGARAGQNANPQGPSNQNENGDVNKGGNGWPSSDPSEFDQRPNGH